MRNILVIVFISSFFAGLIMCRGNRLGQPAEPEGSSKRMDELVALLKNAKKR